MPGESELLAAGVQSFADKSSDMPSDKGEGGDRSAVVAEKINTLIAQLEGPDKGSCSDSTGVSTPLLTLGTCHTKETDYKDAGQ